MPSDCKADEVGTVYPQEKAVFLRSAPLKGEALIRTRSKVLPLEGKVPSECEADEVGTVYPQE